MSDEVTRQMREEREDAVDAFQIAFERLQRLGIEHPEPKRKEPTLTERIDEHCRLVAMAEESVKSPTSKSRNKKEMEWLRKQADKIGYSTATENHGRAEVHITFEDRWVRIPDKLDPQLAINEFRACKQDPAFSAWATKWAVRLCRALGAE